MNLDKTNWKSKKSFFFQSQHTLIKPSKTQHNWVNTSKKNETSTTKKQKRSNGLEWNETDQMWSGTALSFSDGLLFVWCPISRCQRTVSVFLGGRRLVVSKRGETSRINTIGGRTKHGCLLLRFLAVFFFLPRSRSRRTQLGGRKRRFRVRCVFICRSRPL